MLPIDPIVIGGAAAIFFVVAMYSYISSCFKRVIKGQYTYIVVDSEGFKESLESSKFVWAPISWVLKGPSAPNFCYETIDPSDLDAKSTATSLLDRKTGKVNLQVQHYTCPPFPVETADPKTVIVTVELTFKLDPLRLNETMKLGNFGRMLRSRLEEGFREEFGKTDDRFLGREKASIRKNIIDILKVREDLRQPIGVDFIDVAFQISRPDRFASSQSNVVNLPISSNTNDETSQDNSIPINMAPQLKRIEDIDEQKLDSIRDTFLFDNDNKELPMSHEEQSKSFQYANEMLLKILEMQARQNIAQTLVNSGSLMILSNEDLGINSGGLLREPLRKIFY